jgi:hypothetical protein
VAKKAKKKPLDLTLPIFQFKISLEHIDPPIWRRIQMDDCTLEELHDIIQIAIGWEEMHMHAFVVDDEQYGDPRHGGDFEYDSRSVRLSDLVGAGHTRFGYDYDFGDDWEHIVEVETTLPAEAGVRYPRCLQGERACPPEDCGGPFEYPFLLEKIQDPENEEHDEMLEWVGEDFDPEKFNLEEVNGDLYYLRRWLGRRKGKDARQAAFSKGDLVRVKSGVVHHRYPDIPMGGWVGKIKRIGWLTPVGYAVHWTQPTLEQIHPIYLKRCQRDHAKPHRFWLEEDQLEAAVDETPAAMDQPTSIVTRPLSESEFDDRIRMVFGLTSDDPLPKADEPRQRQFLDYLKARLSFPFEADYWPTSALGPHESGIVTVLGFSDPPLDPTAGIVCEAHKKKKHVQVPLAGLQVKEDDPNSQHVHDYTDWLSEAQDYQEEEDEPADPAQFPIGTIAWYGPDDTTTTKVVAGVIQERRAEPIIKRWVATDVTSNPKVQKEIDKFFKQHGVKQVAMSKGNIGCPHEEGEDFPVGGDCPFCPFWKGKQGSGAGR